MAVSTIQASFPQPLQQVWDTVTSVEKYGWRSDLSRVEILKESQFVEYTKDGFATTFTVTIREPLHRWEFDMDNANISGHWSGLFSEKDGQTQVTFTEDVTAKKPLMRPFLKLYLKHQQTQFITDLRHALEK